MKKILILLIFSCVCMAEEIQVGLAEADLLQLKGKPTSMAAYSGKVIYYWPDVEVRIESGKVVSITSILKTRSEVGSPHSSKNSESRRKSDSDSVGVGKDISGFRSYKWGVDLSTLPSFQLIRSDGRLGTFVRLKEDKMIGVIQVKSGSRAQFVGETSV